MFSARWVLLLGKQRMHVTSQSESSRGLVMPASALPLIRTDTLNSDMNPIQGEEADISEWHSGPDVRQRWTLCRGLLPSFVHWYSLCGYFSPLFYLHDSQQAGCGENGKTIQTRILLGSVSEYCLLNGA